jgi:GNAT superfamily N-acetyltransferase
VTEGIVTTASPYATRPLDTDEAALEAYRTLLGVTSAPCEAAYLRWLYGENPWGTAVGFNAYEGDELAAHYATIPVEATLEGAPAKGLLSLNTATHPTHQGKGLFTRLAEQTYAHARDRGYEFVVGVANANSTPGFTRKLGFQLVTPLDVLVGMGRFSASHDDVGFALAWTETALRWRLRRPHGRYITTTDEPAIVYAPTDKLGILAYMTHAPAALTTDLTPLRRTQPFRMWIGIDPHLQRRGVLAPLPDRLKPSPLNLIFRDLTGKQRRLSRDSTRFTLIDFDAY